MEKVFSVEEGIAIQQEQLRHWEKILTTSAFKALVNFAERNNTTAKNGYGIVRGADLSVFLSNYSQECTNEVNPTRAQKGWIKQANKYLHFEEDGSDQAILTAIGVIRDHEDQTATVDIALGDDENVFVIEKFEYNFTCKDFLVLIGYHPK